jgi:hypothetical protein
VCGRYLESFGIKSEMTWGELLFIGLKLSAAVPNARTAADSFGTYQQWFWFKTVSDEGIISSGSRLNHCG